MDAQSIKTYVLLSLPEIRRIGPLFQHVAVDLVCFSCILSRFHAEGHQPVYTSQHIV